jgi:hypothetical protein
MSDTFLMSLCEDGEGELLYVFSRVELYPREGTRKGIPLLYTNGPTKPVEG